MVLGAVDDFDEVWLDGQRIGRTSSETPQAWKTPRVYRLAASQLRRDRPNVLLVKVTNGAFDGGIDGPVALGVASRLLPNPPVAPPLTQHDIVREGGATILRMTAPDGNYEYHAEFVLPDDRAAFTRRLSVTNRSATEQLFQTMFYVTPPLAVGADAAVIFPGSLPVGDTALLSLGDGASVSRAVPSRWPSSGPSSSSEAWVRGSSVRRNTRRCQCAAWEPARRSAIGRT